MLRTLLRWSVPLALALPAPASAQMSMAELWPNADGLKWSYALHYESLIQNPQTVDGEIRLVLDGLAFAPTSIIAQYLHHESFIGAPSPLQLQTGISDPFLQHLWLARPDLRGKIRERLEGAPCPSQVPAGPFAVLLNGEFAFLKTATEVAAWRCDLADTRSWQWLADDLMVGHHLFTLQLTPDISSDIVLHAEVAAIEPTTVPAGTFPECVRVDYIVEYGSATCVDNNGEPTGTSKAQTRGYIRFVPNVGPVESFEEFIPLFEVIGSCGDPELVGQPYERVTMKLLSMPTPARAITWGKVKTLYR